MHIILLGDSILDNAAYVMGGPDVRTQLQWRLPPGSKVSLNAVDGSVTFDVQRQLKKMPADATHLIVSAGGNDALANLSFLDEKVYSAAEALEKLADIADWFEHEYDLMLQSILSHKLATVLCTIYYPRFPDRILQRTSVTALSTFNDCITRAAFSRGLPLLDLRLICNEDCDYANPIEPSAHGGEKIAAAIVRVVNEHRFEQNRTEVYVR